MVMSSFQEAVVGTARTRGNHFYEPRQMDPPKMGFIPDFFLTCGAGGDDTRAGWRAPLGGPKHCKDFAPCGPQLDLG